MGVHSLIPDEGRAESLWHVGISFKDRPTSADVTRVIRSKRRPQVGKFIILPDRTGGGKTTVEIVSVRTVISDRFDVVSQVKPT